MWNYLSFINDKNLVMFKYISFGQLKNSYLMTNASVLKHTIFSLKIPESIFNTMSV